MNSGAKKNISSTAIANNFKPASSSAFDASKPSSDSQQTSTTTVIHSTSSNTSSESSKPVKAHLQGTKAIDNKIIDEESQKGRFGWTIVSKVHIPYIIRNGIQYCATRMVEMKIFDKWFKVLHSDLYNCTNIGSYYITDAEARLLNEINYKHCDYQFGREQFTTKDLIVRLTDANEFCQFLCYCYSRLLNNEIETDTSRRCGFIRINGESVVPFTVYSNEKYVPLFYFEGETDNLIKQAAKLDGWNLAYLKFCCKIQGIRNELFAHDSCLVISLEDIKKFFPQDTKFDEYWPQKKFESSQLLIKGGAANQSTNVHWTRQPATPPNVTHLPQFVTPIQPKVPNNIPHVTNSFSNYSLSTGYLAPQVPYRSTMANTVKITNAPTSMRNVRPHMSTAVNIRGLPPPNVTFAMHNHADLQSVTQNVPHQANPISESSINYNMPESRGVLTNGHSKENSAKDISQGDHLISIPEVPAILNTAEWSQAPYKIQKIVVEGKSLPCINMQPGDFTELLVSVIDLVEILFDYVSIQSCRQVMQVLNIGLYKPNTSQMKVLFDNGRCKSINDLVPLVHVRNVMDYITVLKYMLNSIAEKQPKNS